MSKTGRITDEETKSMLAFLNTNGPCSIYEIMRHMDRSEGGVRGLIARTQGIYPVPSDTGNSYLYTYKEQNENVIVLPCGSYVDYTSLFEKLRERKAHEQDTHNA